jgi:hypothetical protein
MKGRRNITEVWEKTEVYQYQYNYKDKIIDLEITQKSGLATVIYNARNIIQPLPTSYTTIINLCILLWYMLETNISYGIHVPMTVIADIICKL